MATINYYYTKVVLQTASENPLQFKKELQQAKKSLLPFEIDHLTKWLDSYITNKPELKKFIEKEQMACN